MKVHRGQGWTLLEGDCLEAMAKLRGGLADVAVTDPPYELGFMGKGWDSSGIAFRPETWALVLKMLKPGGHLLAFGGSRTFHRIAVAIEDAGFEIRDTLSWLYGTGFPKSLDVSRAIDAAAGAERAVIGQRHRAATGRGSQGEGGYAFGEDFAITAPATDAARQWEGWGTALKPAWEPVILARKPLAGTVAANVQAHGTGALNIDGCRIATAENLNGGAYSGGRAGSLAGDERNAAGQGMFAPGRAASAPYVQPSGRWPANVLLDEHAAELLDAQTGVSKSGAQRKPFGRGGIWTTEKGEAPAGPQYGDSGGASRFFYVAKASRAERDAGCEALPARSAGEATDREDGTEGLSSPRAGAGRTGGARNIHPTVKPIALMRWLVRLITPPGGTVLDPFTGSGSTGVATLQEGFTFIGCEREPQYAEIAVHRLTHVTRSPK